MLVDILLLFVLGYGLYVGYTQGVFRVGLLATAIISGLLFAMYLTAPATEFATNFFGLGHKLLALLVFVFLVLLLLLIGILIYKKVGKKIANTKLGNSEKYFGAIVMSFLFSFLYAIMLSFFASSSAIKTDIREKSLTYVVLERFSDGGIELLKKLAPFVNTFTETINGNEKDLKKANKKEEGEKLK